MEGPAAVEGGDAGVTASDISKVLSMQKDERASLKKKHDRIRSGIPRKDRIGRQRFLEEANEEEERLSKTHKAQLEEFKLSEEELTNEINKLSLTSPTEEQSPQKQIGQVKESKAARRRRKKAEQETESQRRIEQEKNAMGPSAKAVELNLINEQIQPKNFIIYPILADGHCLYSAIVHQMKQNHLSHHSWSVDPDVQSLRNATADFLLSHQSEFIPFIESVQNNPQKFAEYCEELKNTAVWGGHVELQVISKILSVMIEVYAANSPVIRIGEDDNGIEGANSKRPILRLSFHKQYLGLGEHYNSVITKG